MTTAYRDGEILNLDDETFCLEWPAMSVEERAALPDHVRSVGFDRYRRLTGHVDATIRRLNDEQAREGRAQHQPGGGNAPASDADGRLVLRCVADIEERPVHWLWPGRIARGKVTLIAGHPGLGKSQVCLSMAATVTTGEKWPDQTPCERGSVVIFSAEDDPEDTIRPRLRAAGVDLSRCHVFHTNEDRAADGTVSQRGFSLATDLPRLSAALAELRDVALVDIDPIGAFLGDTDSHRDADVRALLAPLAELAAKHDVAIVALAHLRKNAHGEAVLQVTGSVAFVAAARAAYIVTKDPENPQRRLILPIKNNLGPDQGGYAFSIENIRLDTGIETSRVRWEAEAVTVTADEVLGAAQNPEERSATGEAAHWLRDLLKTGPMKASDVQREARQAGICDKAFRSARERLRIKPRKSSFTGAWVWGLPNLENPKGVQDAQEKNMGTLGRLREIPKPSGPDSRIGADGDGEAI